MCNLFLCLRPPTGRHLLILLSNRDEVLARPTEEAKWRDGILSGIDLQDPLRGSWFGINEQGKIGVLLSITQKREEKRADATSRGRIVHDFLSSSASGAEFCSSLCAHASDYNGFTFVGIDRSSAGYEMHSLTNALVDEFATLAWPNQGAHVVGNCPPHTHYAKMKRGKQLLEEMLSGIGSDSTPQEIAESLFLVGQDRVECYPDAQLDSQVNEFNARALSSIFLRVGQPPFYGTRCQTALIISNDGEVFVRERRLLSIGEDGNEEWASSDFSFTIPQ